MGSGAITGGSPRIRERCQDARLVPQGGAPRARDPEGGLQRPHGGGDIAGRELGGAEKRRGLDLGERTSPLSRHLDSTAATRERAGEIAPQPQHLTQESVRPVQSFESALLLVGEERFQGGLSLGQLPEVGARQGPPDAAKNRGGGTPERFPQLGVPREAGQGALGARPRGMEAADPELRVRQHCQHLERERVVVGFLGELRGPLRTREVLGHVAREAAEASIGREQERVGPPIPQSLDDRSCLFEEDL